ncbi:DMSO/selenate family reductase complex A subunit [Pengzhenrongella sicca]|uniref:Molybdopterin-dependent oxidoreductase n=1 Tax=Pengzhenrongella sicca TaxID=2819238 RepID=A0A8A4ZF18_9MICO|nr:DMSO/selenate family reductase complex A subunit [Pengzhenrongella sicca]QTE28288.1 molybdopterin-dependent oxidoreductase [Pengzhenrongella sicca]
MTVETAPEARAEGVPRRSFLKWSGAAGGAAALVTTGAHLGALPGVGVDNAVLTTGALSVDRTTWSACIINCGSRCPLRLQVTDGTIVRVLPDDSGDDELLTRQIRACVRGRSMRQRIYNPDRLKAPLKRVGERGSGEFEEISWDEAFTLFAEKLTYTIETYGNEAVYKQYGSGTWNGLLSTSGGWKRLLNLMGGCLGYYGNYSYAQIGTCTRFHYGNTDEQMSNSFEDSAANSKLIVLWGNNPQETRMSGGGVLFTSMWAKKKAGVKIIVIDPRQSDSVVTLADEWLAPRPGTDAALVAGMAHAIISEGLQDQAFLDTYCQGFDEAHMPAGVPAGNSYRSYVLGEGPDGVAKTPEWAAGITGVPAASIIQVARQIALAGPVNITQGWGPQRHANGENQARAIYTLAALTGNVGIPGGGTGGREGYYWPVSEWFPDGDNPVTAKISVFGWTDAIVRGPELTKLKDGVRGKDKLDVGIKFMLAYAGNMLSSQHADINRTREILSDTSLCEFIVVVDNQMTASAKMADLILPDTTTAERWDMAPSEYTGDMAYVIMCEKAIEPLFNSMPSYEMCTQIAKKLGIEAEFTEGRTEEQWVRWLHEQTRAEHPDFPEFEQLREQGVYRYTDPDGYTVPLKAFRDDPVANPLETPSGKIELFSSELWEMTSTWEFPDAGPGDKLTALPEHVDTWEGALEARTNTAYPLQVIGHHFKGRTHSTYGNLAWTKEAHPQKVWINSSDAKARGIENDDLVEVFNDRGRIRVPAKVTARILPGVMSVPQGAWFAPDKDGVDTGGAMNTLTNIHPTPLSKGNGQHTTLAQVEKVSK